MSNFNEKDFDKIQKWGNSKAEDYWMAGHNSTLFPIPERRDLTKMKEFMRMKYVQKRFLEDEDNSDDSDEDSEEETKKKHKKKKKAKKAKKSKKKKKKQTSSEDDSDDDESEQEEHKQEKPAPTKKKVGFKTAPKGTAKAAKAKVSNRAAPKPSVEQPKEDLLDILDFGPESAPPAASASSGGDSGWATFESGTQQEPTKAQESNDLWGAFDTPTQKEKSANDLVSSLGDLYGQAAKTQQQQVNPFGAFGMQNMPQSVPQTMQQRAPQGPAPTNSFGMGTTQPQTTPASGSMPGAGTQADPFMSAMQEEQKLQYEQMQKAQAAKLAQQTAAQANGSNAGVTPNMFFQQMFQMMGNQGGQNQQQNAMMLAAMQSMMQQMSVGNQEGDTNAESKTAPAPAPAPQRDTSNGAFKSLFNNAATSATTGARHSDITGSTSSHSFNSFDQAPSSMPGSARDHEPSNPFSNFGSAPEPPAPAQPPTQSDDIFNGGFSNSGWSGGQTTPAQPAPSNNPFDMFK